MSAPRVRILGVREPGAPEIFEEPARAPGEGEVAVETLFSGISAGTELTFVRGTNPALTSSFDRELSVFRPDHPSEAYPVRRLGYMEVARVVESRSPAVREGETVAMTYGHRSRHVVDALTERIVPLPDGLDPLLGIYVAHMGPICANGLLHAAADAVGTGVRRLGDGVEGRTVLVTGAGVVGVLCGLLARHHGAAEVVVSDPDPGRLEIASRLGLGIHDEREGPVWAALKPRWRHAAADRGADVAFQCRGRDTALADALRAVRPQGTVIDLAFYTGGAGALRLGEEFHHNGLSIRCAQIGRVPRGLAHAWDRERLSRATIDLLLAHGDAVRAHLITDVLDLDEARGFLLDLSARRRSAVQAVIRF